MKAPYTQSTFNLDKERFVCDVGSSSEVPIVFKQIVDKIYSGKSAEFQGIIIQPKTQNGIKLFLGLRKNDKFGSIIILGTHGDSSEIINDIGVGFPPLNQVLARQIIENAKIFSRTTKTHLLTLSQPPKTGEIMVRFCQLIFDFPEMKQIDINPLIVNAGSVSALDAMRYS